MKPLEWKFDAPFRLPIALLLIVFQSSPVSTQPFGLPPRAD